MKLQAAQITFLINKQVQHTTTHSQVDIYDIADTLAKLHNVTLDWYIEDGLKFAYININDTMYYAVTIPE